jgi:phosphatidylserine decarboxylase
MTVVTSSSEPVDVRRRAGWLPQNQDDLESWLAGHRQRVDARGKQLVFHPVLIEFQELVDADPIVRMHLNEMIAQVPKAKQYRKRHLDSVAELLRLINEVLTVAPEFGDQNVTLPLGCDPGLDDGDIGRVRSLPRHPHQRRDQEHPGRVEQVSQ